VKCNKYFSMLTFLIILPTYAGTWTTLDYGGDVTAETVILGIDGDNLVGTWSKHGFLYNTISNSWTTIDYPDSWTELHDIEGDKIAGLQWSNGKFRGFISNGTTWTILDYPGSAYTQINGINNSKVVGSYYASSPNYTHEQGFVYDGTTWTSLDFAGSVYTSANGIEGSIIVGTYDTYDYRSGDYRHGFIYDGTTWTTLDVPGSDSTGIRGINENNIYGGFTDGLGTHGFIYDGTNWTTLDMPGITGGRSGTCVTGVEGFNVVGYYSTSDGDTHGFIYEIPEPASMLLMLFGAAMWMIFFLKPRPKISMS